MIWKSAVTRPADKIRMVKIKDGAPPYFFYLFKTFEHRTKCFSDAIEGRRQNRWYYDTSDGTCKVFQHLGKGGNGNRFLTRQTCEALCQPSQDICELPKVQGPCSERIEQFWYDKDKDECFSFTYGKWVKPLPRLAAKGKRAIVHIWMLFILVKVP